MRARLPTPPALPDPSSFLDRRRLRNPTPTSDAIHNARVMRGDAIAMGVIAAASTFLPVLVARLGGSAFSVSLLTAIPAVAGFLLAIPLGQYLQRRTTIVPWYSRARLTAHFGYAVIAFVVLLAPAGLAVPAILIVWALASVPSTIGMLLFPLVMDAAAGPHGRLELMSRRWAVMGLTMAITVALIGQFLDRLTFPMNYVLVFVGFGLAGIASYHFSHQFRIPPGDPPPSSGLGVAPLARLRQLVATARAEPAFLHYSVRQLIYISGVRFALPLIPLYYVRVVEAPDAWIGIIATVQSLALLVGYLFWRRQSQLRGTRIILLVALLVSSLFPAVLSLVRELIVVAILAGGAALFTAGVDLILFDELMRSFPRRHGVTFVSIDTTIVNLATIIAPLAGAGLAALAGLEVALQFGSFISLAGVVLFVQAARRQPARDAQV